MLALLVLLCAPVSGHGSSPIGDVICAPGGHMTERLTGRMNSAKTASGLRNPEEVVEVWTDPQGDWVMVIRYASGNACIVAMGGHWQAEEAG